MRKLLFILPLLTLTVFAAATRFQYFETWSTKLSNQDLTISPSGTGVLSISSDATMTSTGALKVPVGTEAQRPTGAAGKFRFNSDTSGFEGHDGSTWGPIGGGGGGGTLKIFHQQEFETTVSASDFTCGTSLTAADETTDEIAGDTSLSITQGATPPTVGVECVSPTITLEKAQIDKFFGVDFYTTWTGNDNEMDFVVYDQGNNELVRVPIKASTVPLLHSGYGETLSTSTSIRYEIEVAVQNASDELIIDDIEFKVDPLTPTDIYVTQDTTPWTPTVTGFDSVSSNSANYWRQGKWIYAAGRFTTGTINANTVSISLPSGLTIDADYLRDSCGGDAFKVIATGVHFKTICIGGASVIYFGAIDVSAGSNDINSATTGTGGSWGPSETIYWQFKAPIEEWRDTAQGVVVKNVESSDIANTNIFSARVDNNGSSCTVITENIDFIDGTVCTRNGTGDCTCSFVGGVFSVIPSGQVVAVDTNTKHATFQSLSTSSFRVFSVNESGSATDTDFLVSFSKQGTDFVKESEKVYTVPVDSLTGNYVKAEGWTAGGTVASGGTFSFDEVVDTAGAWDGTSYTVQKNNSRVILKVQTNYNASVNDNLILKLNGVTYKKIGPTTNTAEHMASYESTIGEFSEGDVLTITPSTGGTVAAGVSVANHYVNIIEEYGDRGIFIGTAPTDFVTEKILSGNSTTTGDISDLQFTGLTVGRWYEVTGQVSDSVSGTNAASIEWRDTASGAGNIYAKWQSNTDINTGNVYHVSFKFKATSTTLYSYQNLATGTIVGDSTKGNTFLHLTELYSTR